MQLNIRSLPENFDKLKILLQRLGDNNVNLDRILLCETYLKETNANVFSIPGYQFYFTT